MNNLVKYLVDSVLLEETAGKKVVVYSGRFQPFHKGHYATYQNLVSKFGKDNVYIATSNKTDSDKSPFGFIEKKLIMNKMFGIPTNKIVQIKNPYAPVEVLDKYDETKTAYITAVGEKDASRLGGKYFEKYKDNTNLEGYMDKGYVYIVPAEPEAISGTDVRNMLGKGSDKERKAGFMKAYPKFDEKIFKLITLTLNKLREDVIPGGLSAGKTLNDVAEKYGVSLDKVREEIKKGIKVEKEHTSDLRVAAEIAKDHLWEDLHYYEKLATIEMTENTGGDAFPNDGNSTTGYIWNADWDDYDKQSYYLHGLDGWDYFEDEPSKKFKKMLKGTTLPIDNHSDENGEYYQDTHSYISPEDFFKLKEAYTKGQLFAGNLKINGVVVPVEVELVGADNKTNQFITKIIHIDSKYHNKFSVGTILPIPARIFRFTGGWRKIKSPSAFGEMAKADMDKVEKYADSQLSPEDVVLGKETDHFFQRLNDPRNGKEISPAELTGFFKRLSQNKKKFLEFLKQYREFVVYDKRSDINIPFLHTANKLIAKTVMRKADFKSSTPIYNTESINEAVKWEEDTYKKCMIGKLPLTLNIVKQLVDPIKTISLHATDVDNLPKVAALEGTKKSISTFNKTTKWGKLVQGKGLHTKGGIIVALSGTVLAQSIMDLWTEPDTRGLRWVEPGTVLADLGREQDVVFTFAPELKKYKENWKQHSFDGTITNAEKHEFIQKYIDAAYKYMLSKKKQFQDTYLNSNTLYYDSDWNEVVLTDIKIEKILAIPFVWDGDEVENETILKQLKQKYKNVEVATKESDIQNFIKKNGGYIKESVEENELEEVREGGLFWQEILNLWYKDKIARSRINNYLIPNEKQQHSGLIRKKLEKMSTNEVESMIKTLNLKTKHSIGVLNIYENLLTEGGAYGHMNHPFDIEMNLTFGDLKNIVKKALSGKLEFSREKTDGQALAVSWVNGRLVAARNKSHLKSKGKDAMSVQDVIAKFAGRGSVSDAFSFAIKDLESAIKGLPEASKKKIFKDGKCFMNCEIIYPANTNVIPYGQSLLVFHGTMEYDEAGNAIGQNAEAGTQLAAMVKKVNADVQDKFTIQGPPVQKLPNNKDLKAKQPIFLSKIQALQSEFGLSDKNGVADYHQAWWLNFINKNTTGLDEQQKIGLVKRWAFGDKGFRIKDIKDQKNRDWAEKIEKQDQQKITKDNLLKFETIFLGVGAEVLSFMTSVLTVNPEAAKQQMVGRLQTAIDSIKATGDAKNLDKLNIELARIEALGGFDKIVPNEGIVFNYKGNTFKLTGAFAPLNQILGIFTFSR